MMLSAPQAIYD